MGKYLNISGTRCLYCHSNLFPMDLAVNPHHLYPIGIIYRCGAPCNRTRIWTNSIRGGQRGYAALLDYLEYRTDSNIHGVCNDQYCAKCWGYVQCLKNGYSVPGAHRRADLFGCPKPECDNRYAAWTDRYDEENPDVDDDRSYYSFYRFYLRHLPQLKTLFAEQDRRSNPFFRNPLPGLRIDEIPESSCDCPVCQAMCHRTPCWPTPSEALHLLQMGYGERLDLEYYQTETPRGGWKNIWAVVPKLRGTEIFPKGCTFQDDRGLCELHARCKPLEGRLAHHSGTPFSLRYQVALLWDTPEGHRVVEKFKSLGY